MALVVNNPITNIFAPTVPGFAGGNIQLPVGDATGSNKSGTVPQSFLFDEFQSLQDQGLKSNVASDGALPFNSFNNDIFNTKLDTKESDATPQPFFNGSGPLRIFDTTLIPPLQQEASKQSLATGSVVTSQDIVRQNNLATIEEQKKIAAARGFSLIDPTLTPEQNRPASATTLSQFGDSLVRKTEDFAKGATSKFSDGLSFVVDEIISKNLLLFGVLGVGIYVFARSR